MCGLVTKGRRKIETRSSRPTPMRIFHGDWFAIRATQSPGTVGHPGPTQLIPCLATSLPAFLAGGNASSRFLCEGPDPRPRGAALLSGTGGQNWSSPSFDELRPIFEVWTPHRPVAGRVTRLPGIPEIGRGSTSGPSRPRRERGQPTGDLLANIQDPL